MKTAYNKQVLRFYLLTGGVFLLFRLLHHISNFEDTVGVRTVNDLWRYCLLLLLNYLLYEYTIPFVRRKRTSLVYNLLWAIFFFVLYVMCFSWGVFAWRAVGVQLGIYTSLVTNNEAEHIATEQMAFSMMTVVFFGIGRHIYGHIKLKNQAQQLTIEKQQAELGYLKAQTNPHFLFNTLNNIYSLARDKNDLAPESILRLSKILRFMLYEAGGDYIPVEQELRIINDYIELEKLRYDETLRINFSYDVEDMKQGIPPLLLIPLVENAFKHGVSETRTEPFIEIHLSIRNRQLVLVVKNSAEGVTKDEAVKENIGLSNLRRQLQLLYRAYDLTVKQAQHTFSAVLKINLASHV